MPRYPLREQEVHVAECVGRHFGAKWHPGEDPPDIYLDIDGHEMAVEITMLAQMNRDGTKPRLSDDATGLRMVKELGEQLAHLVPEDRLFAIGVSSPILRVRKTKSLLGQHLMNVLDKAGRDLAVGDTTIVGNAIRVKLCKPVGPRSDNCCFGYTLPNGLGYDTFQVTLDMLERCISRKANKCRDLLLKGPVWLALISDYFFAELHILQQAMVVTDVANPFAKVLFIDRAGSVGVVR